MAIILLIVMIVCAGRVGSFQYAIILAKSAPIVIPGQTDLPIKIINAKAIPEGGQVGNSMESLKAKKYPNRAET
jgi:hypothetical protein